MSKGIITYEDKSGDISHVWINADSESDAESEVRSEYGDIAEIIEIYKSI